MPLVYLNGEFLPPGQARISVMDRGFLFGDGVYEVIPVYGGQPFRLAQHLRRLDASLAAIHLAAPHSHTEWLTILERLIAADPTFDLSVYVQITRGVAVKRDHAIPTGIAPTVFASVTRIAPPNPQLAVAGVAAITRLDARWQRCDIKAITLLANVLVRQEAADAGVFEAILIRDGLAVEGAASNLFIVDGETLITPPKSSQLLAGITRELVLELAAHNVMNYREAAIPLAQLQQANEIWLTSSTKEVLPVTRLDQQPVGTGRPGPCWQRMHALYQAAKVQAR